MSVDALLTPLLLCSLLLATGALCAGVVLCACTCHTHTLRLIDTLLSLTFASMLTIAFVFEPAVIALCGWEGLETLSCQETITGRMWLFYAKTFDPVFLNLPFWLRIVCSMDTLVFGPFYFASVLAFSRGQQESRWYRALALPIAGALIYSTVLYYVYEVLAEAHRARLGWVFLINAPWTFAPLLLILRLCREQGCAVRAAPPDCAEGALIGKTILLTGGTAGLGTGILRSIVENGPPKKILLFCRCESRARRAAEAAGAIGLVEPVIVNLDSISEVHASATQVARRCASGELPLIDVCFLNAACITSSTLMGERVLTPEGLETMFAVNHCSIFLIVRLLAPHSFAMRARVIITGSDAALALGWHLNQANLQGEQKIGFGGFMQYVHTKVMNAAFASELQSRADEAEREGSGGIDVTVCHPGAVMSELGNNIGPRLAYAIKSSFGMFFRSPDVAAPLIMYPALHELPQRGYIGDGNFGKPATFAPLPFKGSAADPSECRWLWEQTEHLLGAVLESAGHPRLLPLGGAKMGSKQRRSRSPAARVVRK